MRRVTNQELATAIKLHRIQGQPVLVEPLGRSTERDVSQVRTFSGFQYYTFSDGVDEHLVVSKVEEQLFTPLLGIELGVPELDDAGVLTVPSSALPADVDLSATALTYGDTRESLPAAAVPEGFRVDLAAAEGQINLGSVPRLVLTFTRSDQVFAAGYRLPHVAADQILAPVGLAVRPTRRGYSYFFRSDQSQERLEELAELIENGEVPARFVDVIAKLSPGQERKPHPISVEGREFLAADFAGFRHLISETPSRLHSMPPGHALAIAEALRLGAKPQKRHGPLISRVRPTGLKLRRGTAAQAVRTLGFEHYERSRLAFRSATSRTTPYQSYAEGIDASSAAAGTVLIDGYHGKSFSGSMLAISREWPSRDPGVRLHIAVQNPDAWAAKLDRYSIRGNLVKSYSQEYYDLLRTAEHVLTDSTVPRSYIKVPGQRLINTWHGTPLKRMGRHISAAPLALANVQRNFLLSDLVSLNSQYAIDRMTSAYMVDGTNFQLLPSPRNSMLLASQGSGPQLRAELGIGPDEVVVLWMPTWRGAAAGTVDVKPNVDLFHRMARIRQRLRRPVRFFAKTHQFLTDLVELPETGLERFPDTVDVYEFLSIVDVLVTDYSSVFFDFAVRNKPIVLDMADLHAYAGERGLYLDPQELPFAVTGSQDELVAAIDGAADAVDFSDFNARYNPLDDPAGVGGFLTAMLDAAPAPVPAPERERVIIFPGSLKTNGITTSFLNLLSNLGSERDYEILLPLSSISAEAGDNLTRVIESGRGCIISPRGIVVAPKERFVWTKFNNRLDLEPDDWSVLLRIFRREAARLLGERRYDHAIHFSGYDALPAGVLGVLDARSHVYVHNNMKEELELRNNFNDAVLQWAYSRATTIPVVSQGVLDKLAEVGYLAPDAAPRARVVHNTLDQPSIVERSGWDEEYLTEELRAILADPTRVRFVNIARFSPEKGQDRLIRAFEAVSQANPDHTFELFLIGGPGNSRKTLHDMKAVSRYGAHIHFFENINPMPILASCDLFVLSSHYEGFGMVLLEAIALGVPVMSTRIPGPEAFLGAGYGHLVPDSTEGLIDGMQEFVAGHLHATTRSLDEYNQQAVSEFLAILDQPRVT